MNHFDRKTLLKKSGDDVETMNLLLEKSEELLYGLIRHELNQPGP